MFGTEKLVEAIIAANTSGAMTVLIGSSNFLTDSPSILFRFLLYVCPNLIDCTEIALL